MIDPDPVELLLDQFPAGHPAIDELIGVRSACSRLKEWNKRLEADKAELLAALREAADVIQDLDGGNPATNTGWATSEALHAWMITRAAIAKVSK